MRNKVFEHERKTLENTPDGKRVDVIGLCQTCGTIISMIPHIGYYIPGMPRINTANVKACASCTENENDKDRKDGNEYYSVYEKLSQID